VADFDLSEFRAPFIDRDEIHRAADSLRQCHMRHAGPPVDIHAIIEFDLGLEIRPIANLRSSADIDALLLGDRRTIVVDSDRYMRDSEQNRLRFSLAHEVGHLILHRDVHTSLQLRTLEDWHEFVRSIPEKEYRFIEYHAHEFAGRLLVDPNRLRLDLRQCVQSAVGEGLSAELIRSDQALEYIASRIACTFGVSAQVIEKRLARESLWPPDQE
jgi:hypothetical protein